MATPVIMPRQGQSVESCIITKLNIKKGDMVKPGDILFSYETDKAAFEEESKVSGEVLDVFFHEGDDVECLLNVCVIGEQGEDISAYLPQKSEETQIDELKEVQAEVQIPAIVEYEKMPNESVRISPRAKNWANAHGIAYADITGTGPKGRIVEKDVRFIAKNECVTSAARDSYNQLGASIEGTGIGGRIRLADLEKKELDKSGIVNDVKDVEEAALPNIRKVIARSMHQSLSQMAQLTLNTSFDATNITNFRNLLKSKKEDMMLNNITLNDIILFAVAKTLPAFRSLNANFFEDKIVYFNHVNLGVAVDTPRGLMVPTIFAAEKLSLNELSIQTKALISDAQEGKINPDLLTGGSFTVTNLGSLGVESFTPVINPPQTGILGVNCIDTKIKEVDGQIVPYKAMGLSLTFDHRALDGAPAAKFLQALKTNLENFTLLLVK